MKGVSKHPILYMTDVIVIRVIHSASIPRVSEWVPELFWAL